MRRKISFLFILIGIGLFLYPLAGKIYYRYVQSKMMDDFVEVSAVNEYNSLQNVFDSEISSVPEPSSAPLPTANNSLTGTPVPTVNVIPKDGDFLGTLYIEKFELELKIVEGASEKNLEFFIGHLTGTSAIGEIGNTAIAGHRSHVWGNFFNRLDELENDDVIIIKSTSGKVYKYKVYKKLVVDPDDISVLRRSKTQSVLTLITCHPLYISTHRLIIHAVQV